MYSFEMTWISAEIICIFVIIHLPELIFIKFHVIQLMIIEVKSVPLPRYLLKVFLVAEFIVHTHPIVDRELVLTLNHVKVSGRY
jgi:hypothetical protein